MLMSRSGFVSFHNLVDIEVNILVLNKKITSSEVIPGIWFYK
jgi:hypothetical protein